MKRVCVCTAIALTGCSTATTNTVPTQLSLTQYSSYDCEQLTTELRGVPYTRAEELAHLGGTAAEYARLSDEHHALREAAIMKKARRLRHRSSRRLQTRQMIRAGPARQSHRRMSRSPPRTRYFPFSSRSRPARRAPTRRGSFRRSGGCSPKPSCRSAAGRTAAARGPGTPWRPPPLRREHLSCFERNSTI